MISSHSSRASCPGYSDPFLNPHKNHQLSSSYKDGRRSRFCIVFPKRRPFWWTFRSLVIKLAWTWLVAVGPMFTVTEVSHELPLQMNSFDEIGSLAVLSNFIATTDQKPFQSSQSIGCEDLQQWRKNLAKPSCVGPMVDSCCEECDDHRGPSEPGFSGCRRNRCGEELPRASCWPLLTLLTSWRMSHKTWFPYIYIYIWIHYFCMISFAASNLFLQVKLCECVAQFCCSLDCQVPPILCQKPLATSLWRLEELPPWHWRVPWPFHQVLCKALPISPHWKHGGMARIKSRTLVSEAEVSFFLSRRNLTTIDALTQVGLIFSQCLGQQMASCCSSVVCILGQQLTKTRFNRSERTHPQDSGARGCLRYILSRPECSKQYFNFGFGHWDFPW